MSATRSPLLQRILVAAIIVGGVVMAQIFSIASFTTGTTGDIANDIFGPTNYFFPATYVFATIWTFIYAGIVAFGIWQALPAQASNQRIQGTALLLAINMIFNALWVFIFGQLLFVESTLVMLVVLVTGALVYFRLGVNRTPGASRIERLIWLTLGAYFAWLVIATVANITVALIAVEWDGFGIAAETWGVIMIVIAAGLGLLLTRLLMDPAFPAVFAYAFVGVVVRWLDGSTPVALTAAVMAIIFVAALLMMLLRGSAFNGTPARKTATQH